MDTHNLFSNPQAERLGKKRLNKLIKKIFPKNPFLVKMMLTTKMMTKAEEKLMIKIWKKLLKSKLKTTGGIYYLSEKEAAIVIGGNDFWEWIQKKRLNYKNKNHLQKLFSVIVN